MKSLFENQEIINAYNKLEKCKCLTKREKDLLIEFIKAKAIEEFQSLQGEKK